MNFLREVGGGGQSPEMGTSKRRRGGIEFCKGGGRVEGGQSGERILVQKGRVPRRDGPHPEVPRRQGLQRTGKVYIRAYGLAFRQSHLSFKWLLVRAMQFSHSDVIFILGTVYGP